MLIEHFYVTLQVPTYRQMDANWFKKRQKLLGVTSFDLGTALGRDRTVVSKILSGKQPMTLEYAQGFAKVLEVSIDEILRRAGVLSADQARNLRPGFSESDAAIWLPKQNEPGDQIARALGADRPGVDIWEVRSMALSLAGYMPGDKLLVDAHASERCKAGDVVIAQIYNWHTGNASTVLRRFEPPVLVAASTQPDDQKVHVVDGNNVVIKGKVISSWRQ